MKSLILVLTLAFASAASAKSVCAVIEKDEAGNYSRVVAQKTIEADGQLAVIHRYDATTIIVDIDKENTMIGMMSNSTNAVTMVAFGNGTSTGYINAEAGYGVVCQRQ